MAAPRILLLYSDQRGAPCSFVQRWVGALHTMSYICRASVNVAANWGAILCSKRHMVCCLVGGSQACRRDLVAQTVMAAWASLFGDYCCLSGFAWTIRMGCP
jgi:hypothetical protein